MTGASSGGCIAGLTLFDLAPHLVLFLVMAAFVAGLVDSIAGGGGLITVPALLLAGASPLQALATNKLQGSFGAGTAVLAYARAGQVNPGEQLWMAALSALGGAGGAMIAHLVPVQVLRVVMPVVLIAIAAFFALKPDLTDAARHQRLSPLVFGLSIVPVLGAYDGFFGPGTGSFFMMAFVLLAGFGVLKATAHTKMLNLASNLGSLAVFATSGATWWAVGLAMGAAQVAGALIGARLALRVGARVIKPLLVLTSTGMAIRLLWQAFA